MIIGFSDEETVMLDFDETSFKSVRYWARRVSRRLKLGGFIIAKSSENNYHVVFNRRVTWTENMSIIAWTALMSRKEKLRTWLIMQCIKKWPTLRVTPKGHARHKKFVSMSSLVEEVGGNYVSAGKRSRFLIEKKQD